MIEIFDKTRAICCKCKTPLETPNLYKIGKKYYCVEDFEKESIEEKNANEALEQNRQEFKKTFVTPTETLMNI